MSKLTSLIRRAPKRFSAVALMVAAAIIIPAAVFAWGPTRDTFTIEQPADHVKSFGQVDKGKIKRLLLFPAFLLQLSDREDHINSGSS